MRHCCSFDIFHMKDMKPKVTTIGLQFKENTLEKLHFEDERISSQFYH